jgi:hypothetical protein
VDGDGTPDFGAGAPDNDTRASSGGAAYVFYGPGAGGEASGADARIYGTSVPHVGRTIAGAGDTDGDGIDDILLGTDGNTGIAALVLGPPAATMYFESADALFQAESANDFLGGDANELSGAGDVDGDGYDDVWLGAYGNDDGGVSAGKAYLVSGPMSGTVDLFLGTTASVQGSPRDMLLGQGLAEVGDLDGDGHVDAVIGAGGDPRYGTSTGATFVFYGPVAGTLDILDADATFFGDSAGDTLGVSTAAGDLTGDGVPDLLIGSLYEEGDVRGSGSAWVIPGG